ncbi:rhamnan synthesis F family protein [Paraburkholderia aromaticivorans]|uniref:rhamnan synthesis F family protein n=1 Tax=Paraburkholderia aromaticivorans TaxID=2026199 RepID=UPI0038BC4E11
MGAPDIRKLEKRSGPDAVVEAAQLFATLPGIPARYYRWLASICQKKRTLREENAMLSKEIVAPLSPSSFWVPHYFSQSAWIEHAPFAFWLTGALRPKRLVELGTHNGYSYFAFCQAIEHLSTGTAAYAIDTWQGDEHAGFYDDSVYQAVATANERYSTFSSLVRSTFVDASAHFSDKSIDLIHIDGRHFYEDVKEDFECWRPKLMDDAIVLFHDTNVRERGFGVWKFFDELAATYPSFQFHHGNGLGVIALGEIPPSLKLLFESDANSAAQIRMVYSVLGGALTRRRRMDAKHDAISVLLRDESDLSAASAEFYARISDWDSQVQDIRAKLESLKNENVSMQSRACSVENALVSERAALQAQSEAQHAEVEMLRAREASLTEAARRNAASRRLELAEMIMTERRQFAHKDKLIANLSLELAEIKTSASWRITGPLRAALGRSPAAHGVVRKIAKLAYWTVTGQLAKRLSMRREFLRAASLTVAHPTRQDGTAGTRPAVLPREAARPVEIDYSVAIPLGFPPSLGSASNRVAAIVHLHYEDLAGEMRSYLDHIPGDLDVYISTGSAFNKSVIEKAFSGWGRGCVDVRIVPNRGRDIAPKLVSFRDVYDRYPYVLHLHGKRSHHASVLAPWRHFLLENLAGTKHVVESILDIFERNPKIGIVASQHFEPMRHWVNWGGNFEVANRLAQKMGFEIDPQAPLDFPSGSMFWARSAALRPLLDLKLSSEDFDDENGQVDATLAHAVERLYFYVCEHAAFDWIKVARPELFQSTPAIMSAKKAADLDDFFARYVFRLFDPRDVRPRSVHPQPLERPSPKLAENVRESALGLHAAIKPRTRVAIGLLTYNNSEREVKTAIAAAHCSLTQARLPTDGQVFMLDNGASTDSLTVGNSLITKLSARGNIGFGAGHNAMMRAAFEANADIYIAVNPDGALHPNAVTALVQMLQAANGRALVEALQFPSEHPKPYSATTFDTPWVSGACVAIPKAAFEELGGFDDQFFMYCEDVDISWRARANGFALKTCPRALFLHAVTNREQKSETLKMIFESGVLLARKWGAPEFEGWLRSELSARGFPIPAGFPTPVAEEWRRYADFSKQFSFSQPRW